jgi:hypothetical protein
LSGNLPEKLRLPGLFEAGDELSRDFLANKQLYRELILQLRKDFETSAIPIKILLGKRYSFAELSQLIHDAFMEAGATAMFQLLYRVDISEQQLKKGMPTPGIDPMLVAEMVIKRELQKVVLRKMYGQKS